MAWQLSDGLGSNIDRPLDWDENSEDYVTARPDWDGFGSLVLWAAYDDHKDLQLRRVSSNCQGDLAYERATAKDEESLYPHLIRDMPSCGCQVASTSPSKLRDNGESPSGVRFGDCAAAATCGSE